MLATNFIEKSRKSLSIICVEETHRPFITVQIIQWKFERKPAQKFLFHTEEQKFE